LQHYHYCPRKVKHPMWKMATEFFIPPGVDSVDEWI